MNLTAIIHPTGWVAVLSDFGPSSFKRSHGVMKLDTFLLKLVETPDVKRIAVRPPRHNEEWQWEVEHSIGFVQD